jgi:hypothetical protein
MYGNTTAFTGKITEVLLNPAHLFMRVPMADFEIFKNAWIKETPDSATKVDCDSIPGECFYKGQCSDLKNQQPIKIKIDDLYHYVPSERYLIQGSDIYPETKELANNCYLGITGH